MLADGTVAVFPGAFLTTALGINARGEIAGQYNDVMGPPQHGFVLSRENFVAIDFQERPAPSISSSLVSAWHLEPRARGRAWNDVVGEMDRIAPGG